MTGYQSKKAAAQAKLTIDRAQVEHWLQSLKDIDALHSAQEPESVDAQKAIADMGQVLEQQAQEPESECNPQDLCAGCRCKYAAQPAQEPEQDDDNVYHLRQYGDVTREQLERYLATGDINPQPAQEPVYCKDSQNCWYKRQHFDPIYNTPPQRQWVGLTPQDLNEIFAVAMTGEGAVNLALEKIKEKNA
jgi:hypothetical protein